MVHPQISSNLDVMSHIRLPDDRPREGETVGSQGRRLPLHAALPAVQRPERFPFLAPPHTLLTSLRYVTFV